jgi:YkoY family integral membrane protein
MEALAFFGQTFDPHDVATIALLIVLEGVLSIDNALVLGLLAKRLPKKQQSKALTYGLVGAFIFRLIAIATATYLLKWWWVKLIGGGYLVYIAVKHLFFTKEEHHEPQITVTAEGEAAVVDAQGRPLSAEAQQAELDKRAPLPVPDYQAKASFAERFGLGLGYKFWSTVFVIEMTDIAFAIDSILAAIALVGSAPVGHHGPHPKLWVVVTGGMLGVVLMRFAAVVFIKMLERFPRFEMAAYLLVIVIGGKLLLDWWFNRPPTPTPLGWHAPLDFHSASSPAFWTFWGLMLVCFCVGFIPKKARVHAAGEPHSAKT